MGDESNKDKKKRNIIIGAVVAVVAIGVLLAVLLSGSTPYTQRSLYICKDSSSFYSAGYKGADDKSAPDFSLALTTKNFEVKYPAIPADPAATPKKEAVPAYSKFYTPVYVTKTQVSKTAKWGRIYPQNLQGTSAQYNEASGNAAQCFDFVNGFDCTSADNVEHTYVVVRTIGARTTTPASADGKTPAATTSTAATWFEYLSDRNAKDDGKNKIDGNSVTFKNLGLKLNAIEGQTDKDNKGKFTTQKKTLSATACPAPAAPAKAALFLAAEDAAAPPADTTKPADTTTKPADTTTTAPATTGTQNKAETAPATPKQPVLTEEDKLVSPRTTQVAGVELDILVVYA